MATKQGGFIDRLKSATRVLLGDNFIPAFGFGPYAFGGFGGFDVNWKVNYWQDGYMDNETIYEAMRVVLKKIRVAPMQVFTVKNEKELTRFKNFNDSKSSEHRLLAKQYQLKALEEISNHALIDLFNKPNSYQTGMEWREALFGYLLIAGRTAVYKIAPDIGVNKGKPIELHVLIEYNLEPVYSNDYRNPIAYYNYTVDGEVLRLNPENVCYIHEWNPTNTYSGLSPLTPGKKALRTDSLNKTAQAAMAQNGGRTYAISNASETDEYRYTQEQAQLVDNKIAEKGKGAHNSGNIFSIAGKIDVNAIGDSPVDLNILNYLKYNRGVLSNLVGVDGILIGDKEGSTYANADAAYKALVTNTVMPMLMHADEKLRDFLLPAYNTGSQKLWFASDTTIYPELSPDLKLMMEVYGQPKLTTDEQRSIFNWDNHVNSTIGQATFISSSLVSAEDILSQEQPIDPNNQDVY